MNRTYAPTAGVLVTLAVGGSTAYGAQDPAVAIDADDIGGVVASAKGPEAGVWVIAETDAFETRFAKIVVTDDQRPLRHPGSAGRELQGLGARLRARGLRQVAGDTRQERRTSTAAVAPDAATAAKVYPAAYWYAMMKLPRTRKSRTSAAGATST